MDTKRGTGRTTMQVQTAPRNAVYVWCNDGFAYIKAVALKTGRTDLKIVSPRWLDSDAWRGMKAAGIVVDHACDLSTRQWEAVALIQRRCGGMA